MSTSLLRRIPGTPQFDAHQARMSALSMEAAAMQVIRELETEIEHWRDLCARLIANGATLPSP